MSYIFVLSLCRKFDKTSAELHPIPVKGEEWHTIGVDLIGPLPETPRKNKFIMTVSCLFLSGLKQQPSLIRLPSELQSFCSTRHGCCKIKITDQGRKFVNKVPNKQQHLHVCLYEIVF